MTIAEAEIPNALGFELCKCQFPPIPMLTVGHIDNFDADMHGPVYECPKCGYNSARIWAYRRTRMRSVAPLDTSATGPVTACLLAVKLVAEIALA